MSRFIIRIITALTLIGFVTINAQDVHSSIKQETSKLFLNALDISSKELQITFNRLPDNLEKYENKNVEVYSQKNGLKPGTQSVWVRFTDGSRTIKKIPISINAIIIKEVVVAGKRINRGKGLSRTNLKMETRQLGKNWEQYFFSIQDLNGSESKRLIKKGVALTGRMIRETQMVHSGQQVNVRLHAGNLTISTKGVAKQGGAYGNEIKLKIDKTGKTVKGIVSSENLVLVFQE